MNNLETLKQAVENAQTAVEYVTAAKAYQTALEGALDDLEHDMGVFAFAGVYVGKDEAYSLRTEVGNEVYNHLREIRANYYHMQYLAGQAQPDTILTDEMLSILHNPPGELCFGNNFEMVRLSRDKDGRFSITTNAIVDRTMTSAVHFLAALSQAVRVVKAYQKENSIYE